MREKNPQLTIFTSLMQPEKDTILYVLTKSYEYLKSKEVPQARLDAEILLADTLGLERIQLYAKFDLKLNETQKDVYRSRIKERGNRKPVAYIIGKKYFFKSIFRVTPSVLIPRPETEELVEWVLTENQEENLRVLDLCTGSGCIAISLKLEKPTWKIFASDISKEALLIAQENSQTLNASLEAFFQSDLFNSIPPQNYDIIVSNPPYVPISEKSIIEKEVLDYEPHLALFLEDPNSFWEKLLKSSFPYLSENGKLYLETHPAYVERIVEIGKQIGFTESTIKKDLSQKLRFVKLKK